MPHGTHPATGLTVWSLYGSDRRPTATMLHGLDTLVFDIQDVGVRFYTYLTTLVYVLEEAANHRIPVVVLDRPNPLTGVIVEGPVMDADLRSFTAPHPIPVRTGMTMGEFARMVAAERKIPVKLTVVPLEGWERSMWFDETGLPWVNPSPNIRSLTQALLYSGVGLLEATNLSVGRGTDDAVRGGRRALDHRPAAVWPMRSTRLAMPGVTFQPVNFQPDAERLRRADGRRRAARGHRPRGAPPGDGRPHPGADAARALPERSSGRRPSRTSWSTARRSGLSCGGILSRA